MKTPADANPLKQMPPVPAKGHSCVRLWGGKGEQPKPTSRWSQRELSSCSCAVDQGPRAAHPSHSSRQPGNGNTAGKRKHSRPFPGTHWSGALGPCRWQRWGECFPGYFSLQLLIQLVKITSAAQPHSLPSADRTAMYSILIQQEK